MNDLLLGARLAFAGGRDGWTRTVMTAVGVGIGVALLLLAAAVPAALHGRALRGDARTAGPTDPPPGGIDTLLVADASTTFRGSEVHGWRVRPEGPRPPLPPGVPALPAAGEVVVSPALRGILDSTDGHLLAPRLDGARVVGTIGDAGLVGPRELAFYLGSDTLTTEGATRVAAFGGSPGGGEGLAPMLMLLVVLGFVVLLLPVMVFLAAATRFGGDRRDQRLAALRLVGADARMTRRIAAGETIAGALLGIAAGGLLFAVGRELVPLLTIAEISVYAADIRPDPLLVATIVLAVPALAVVVGLLTLRGTVIEPLGVVRRSAPVRRRLWWRLLLPVIGVALLYLQLGRLGADRPAEQYYPYVAVGAVLLLVGVVALLPWLIEVAVHRLRGGPVSWQLAIRRLQLDSATSARLVSGMAVAVAGTIGLQMLFVAAQQAYTSRTGWDDARHEVAVQVPTVADPVAATARIRAVAGVTGMSGTLLVRMVPWRPDATGASGPAAGSRATVRVGDCAALAYYLAVDRCSDGDVFVSPWAREPGSAAVPTPGARMIVGDAGLDWTVPRELRTAPGRESLGSDHSDLLITPGAIDVTRLGSAAVNMFVAVDPAVPDVLEHLRNTAASVDPLAWVAAPSAVVEDRNFSTVRRGLYVGVVVTLLLMGASLLVSVLEQLRDRRRLLATLIAVGTRRRALTWSVLWQLLVPIAVAMVLATLAGLSLGLVLQYLVGAPLLVNWAVVGVSTGLAAGTVLLVNGLSLPALWRLMRPDGLRTE